MYLFQKYSIESLPDEISLQEIANFVEANYPESHSQKQKTTDIANQRNIQLQKEKFQMTNTTLMIARDTSNRIVGLLERQEAPVEGGVYFFITWIIVSELARGTGLSKELRDMFENEVRARKKEISLPSMQILAVHPENHRARAAYKKWGYTEDGRTSTSGNDYFSKE